MQKTPRDAAGSFTWSQRELNAEPRPSHAEVLSCTAVSV